MMSWRRTGRTLVELVLALTLLLGASYAQVATTQVTETIYRADGTAAGGTLLVSWPSFTAASGAAVPAGSTSVTIGTGGVMTLPLVPNAGATPMGSYYTVVYHLDDGSVTREYWVVPVSAYPVQVSTIKSSVLPLSVAMQTVSKAYVDTAVAAAVAGHPLDTSNPYVLKAGDTMTGPLVLPGDPTSALQASDKQYVDEQTTALTAGLAQKVSELPVAAQSVAQPTGTTLAVNNLNGVAYASQYVSSTGNDGIAQATSSTNCPSGCEVVAEPTYGATEAVSPASLSPETHVSDTRGGAVVDTFLNPENPHAGGAETAQTVHVVSTRSSAALKASEGVVQPYSYGLAVEQDSLAGGSNLFPQLVQGSVPYFKTTYTALDTKGIHNTLGQHVLAGFSQTCYAVGDCLIGGQFLTSSGGFRDDADEGTHPFDLQIAEDPKVFEGTCASGCTTGATTVQIAATANPGTQGEGRYLIDTNSAKVLTGGVLTGGTNTDPVTGNLARQPGASFSGTSFAVSTLLETAQTIPTQANDVRPGTVTLAIATSGVPTGFQTNTAALPTASGVACVTDAAVADGRPLNYEMAAYTTVDGAHLSMTLNKAHATGATIAVGGLCGYGLEQTVDTASGIRQVFPVVASTSATTLLYAGGQTAIVGVQGNTSSYLNVNATIASVARSANVVTLTTAGNLPVDVNGLTLTIAGVADSSFNGSFVATSTGPNTLTYAQSGANSTSTSGTASAVTGGYALYPMAEVLDVYNTATSAIDGQMTLAANNVAWAAGDTVEQPHYFQEAMQADTTYVNQTTPRPTHTVGAGVSFGGNSGPGLHGWQVTNLVSTTQYLGNGGTHSAPDVAFEALGTWKRSMSVQAGEQAVFAVHCNSHGCGRWNSTYNLFELDSQVGTDTVQYAPTTSTLGINMRGTQYSFSPAALTAGTINAGTINAGAITGAISAGSLPLFVASGTAHAAGAVPDPGATAGSSRYLREDGTWSSPSPAMPAGVQCEFVYAGGSGSSFASTVNGYNTNLSPAGGSAPVWTRGGLYFSASSHNFAEVDKGCLDNAQTVMVVYTSDVGQNIAQTTGYGVLLASDTLHNLQVHGSAQSQGIYDGNGVANLDRVTGATVQTEVTGNVAGSGESRIYSNGGNFGADYGNATTPTWSSTSVYYLGGLNGASFSWGGTLHALLAWPTQLTPLQINAAYQSIVATLAPYGVTPGDSTDHSRGVVVFDGDSLTEDYGDLYLYAGGMPNQAMDSLGLDVPWYNVAHYGYTTASVLSQFPTKTGVLLQQYGSAYRSVLLETGSNDIASSHLNPEILSETTSYCGLVVAASARCAVTTVLPRIQITGAAETQRQALNAALRTGVLNGSLNAVGLVDWAMDPIMGNVDTPTNASYYQAADGVHQTTAGGQILARYDALAVHRLMSPQTPYWMKVSVNPVAFAGMNSTTDTMPLLQLLPREKVCGISARVNTGLSGSGLTALSATLGNSLGSATTYGGTFDATAVGVQDDGLPASSPPETGVVQSNWTATGGNLSAISAGAVDFDICVVTQP